MQPVISPAHAVPSEPRCKERLPHTHQRLTHSYRRSLQTWNEDGVRMQAPSALTACHWRALFSGECHNGLVCNAARAQFFFLYAVYYRFKM